MTRVCSRRLALLASARTLGAVRGGHATLPTPTIVLVHGAGRMPVAGTT